MLLLSWATKPKAELASTDSEPALGTLRTGSRMGERGGFGLASRESSRWGFSGVAHVALGSRDRLSPRCSGLHLFFPCWQRAYLLHRNVPACLELRVHGRAPVGSVSQTPLYGGCELGTHSASCLVTAPLGPGRGGPARGDAFYAAVA